MKTLALLLLSPPALAGDPAPPPIINGDDMDTEEFPSAGGMIMDGTISVFGNQELRVFVCSTTLIAPDTVVLAAHCLDDAAFTFGMGEVEDKRLYWTREADLTAHDGSTIATLPSDTIEASDWVKHDGFDMNALEVGLADNNDIALLFLETAVEDVAPAIVITAEEAELIAEGDAVDVVGWGQQQQVGFMETPPPGTFGLKQGGLSHIEELAAYEFKVGHDPSDVRKCHGDSGGPSYWTLTEDETETVNPMRVIGATSHAYDDTDCAQTGGVDTRLDYHLAWIDDQMRSRCEDGTRVWCDDPGIIPPEFPEARGACACQAGVSPVGSSGLAGLLALFMIRRRKG